MPHHALRTPDGPICRCTPVWPGWWWTPARPGLAVAGGDPLRAGPDGGAPDELPATSPCSEALDRPGVPRHPAAVGAVLARLRRWPWTSPAAPLSAARHRGPGRRRTGTGPPFRIGWRSGEEAGRFPAPNRDDCFRVPPTHGHGAVPRRRRPGWTKEGFPHPSGGGDRRRHGGECSPTPPTRPAAGVGGNRLVERTERRLGGLTLRDRDRRPARGGDDRSGAGAGPAAGIDSLPWSERSGPEGPVQHLAQKRPQDGWTGPMRSCWRTSRSGWGRIW